MPSAIERSQAFVSSVVEADLRAGPGPQGRTALGGVAGSGRPATASGTVGGSAVGSRPVGSGASGRFAGKTPGLRRPDVTVQPTFGACSPPGEENAPPTASANSARVPGRLAGTASGVSGSTKIAVRPSGGTSAEQLQEQYVAGLKQQIHFLQCENDVLHRKAQEPQLDTAVHVDRLARELAVREDELAAERARTSRLATELEQQRDAGDAHEALRLREAAVLETTQDGLSRELKAALSRAEAGDRDSTVARAEARQARAEADARRHATTVAESDVARAEDRAAALEAELATASEARATVERDLNEVVVASQADCAQLRDAHKVLDARLREGERARDELSTLLRAAQVSPSEHSLEKQLADSRHEAELLQRQLTQARTGERDAADARARLQQKADSLESDMAQVQGELDVKTQLVRQLQTKLLLFDDNALELEQVRMRRQEEATRQTALAADVTALRAERGELLSKLGVQFTGDVPDRAAWLRPLELELADERVRATTEGEVSEQRRLALAELQGEVARLQQGIAALQEEVSSLREKVVVTNMRAETREQELAASSQEASERASDLAQAEARLAASERISAERAAENDGLRVRAERSDREAQDLAKKAGELQKLQQVLRGVGGLKELSQAVDTVV